MERKERIVIIPDSVAQRIAEEPQEVQDEINRIIESLESGDLDPLEHSDPMEFVQGERLLCAECTSNNIQWMRCVTDDEHFFQCFDCGNKGFMDGQEFHELLISRRELVFW